LNEGFSKGLKIRRMKASMDSHGWYLATSFHTKEIKEFFEATNKISRILNFQGIGFRESSAYIGTLSFQL